MPHDREAISTLRGYFYQFDYYILRLLCAPNDDDEYTIEGIEDVDIRTATETTAIQCKYYEGTEFNYSVIGKSLRFMLEHFIDHKDLHYFLYGFYKSGQTKLERPLTLTTLKSKLLTYHEKKHKYEMHIERNLSDKLLQKFLDHLTIDIEANSLDDQQHKIYEQIKKIFNSKTDTECSDLYSSALYLIRKLSIDKDKDRRKITRRIFIAEIKNAKNNVYDAWVKERITEKQYCSMIKKRYFSGFNRSPINRFFLIDGAEENIIDLKKVIIKIAKEWSNISKRQSSPFCPYVYLNNVSDQDKIKLLNHLSINGIKLKDGYDYKGADFNVKSIIVDPTHQNQVTLKFIQELKQIDDIEEALKGYPKEIFQFYKTSPFYDKEISPNHRIIISSANLIINMI